MLLKPWVFTYVLVCMACSPIKDQGISSLPVTPSDALSEIRQYHVRQELSFTNAGDRSPTKQTLWVALIRDLPPYQELLSRTINPSEYTLVKDEYKNQYAEFDFSNHPPGTTLSVVVEYQVAVHELTYDLSRCEGETPEDFTQPELHVESANPQILALASELSNGKKNACDQARAFYAYAGDKLVYTYNREDWGAQATFGLMGSDCSEYASLVMALSRAEGIPARYYEGLLYLKQSEKAAEIAQTEHAWLDVHLPGIGWVAMDPTLGRSPNDRERYFAHYTPNHIIVTTGRNPSTLRGASYWTHLYWPGNSTTIQVTQANWTVTPIEP